MKYLSPSSIRTYQRSPEEFYLYYVALDRPPRQPQTKQMAVGSAFDAFVKTYFYAVMYGQNKFRELFEAQVEPQNRKAALKDGQIVFDLYRDSGALADLALSMCLDFGKPQFEFTLHDTMSGEHGDIPLLGKPDACFYTKTGTGVILDWKVNGFYSMASPKPGYVNIRPGGNCHKDCQPLLNNGLICGQFDPRIKEWAQQTTIYSWLLGLDPWLLAIDQIVWRKGVGRVAQHRCVVPKDWQDNFYKEIASIWEIAHSDWFFRDMTKEESIQRTALLDKRASVLRDEDMRYVLR